MSGTPGHYALYLVVLVWDDNTRTYFTVRAGGKDDAISCVERFAYQEWTGTIVKTLAESLRVPVSDEEPRKPYHLFTEH